MKRTNLLAAASAAVLFATTAQAATYDAFTSFNGTQGAGGFFYGDVSPTVLNLYAANTNCFIDGSTCLQAAPNHDVPGFTKSTVPSFQYNTVNVPTDRLLAHPSVDSSVAASVLFLVSQSGQYNITASFNTQDVSPTGVDLYGIFAFAGSPSLSFGSAGSLSSTTSSLSYNFSQYLNAGDVIGFGIGNGGFYGNDSTGVNFTLTSVPEPATWSLMIVGFGLVGFAMRRRSATTTVTYA